MGSKAAQSALTIKIKQEAPDEEIKEYAETAMNELLGWYGYEKVSSRDTQGLNLHHFASPPSPSHGSDSSSDVEGTSSPPTASPPPVAVPPGCLSCAWCRKVAPAKQFTFKTSTPHGNKSFCSEVCFTQCRRASFKRNKTCDWCRHVRHTVNYVDFQDGDHQLQFCSDKCLNQYKMNIFCKETQAHLQLHPHLKESVGTQSSLAASSGTAPPSSSGSTLITPELWMRDCRSESPDSNKSPSPDRIPSPVIEITPHVSLKTSPPPSSPCSSDEKPTNLTVSSKNTPPPTNPMQRTIKREGIFKSRKVVRNRRSSRVTAPIVTPQVEVNVSTNSSSPRSTNSGSPPKNLVPPIIPQIPSYPLPLNPLLPPDHPIHRPPPFMNQGFFPPPHVLAEFAARFPMPRPQIRKPQPTNNNLPPLLPLNRNIHFPPPLNFPPQPQPPPPLPHSLLPPPTLMVPYPVLIPIPIPLPIPIPIPPDFKLKDEKCTAQSTISRNETEISNIKVEVESPPPQNQSPTLSLAPPLRKRKRPELSSEEELAIKQKSVPA